MPARSIVPLAAFAFVATAPADDVAKLDWLGGAWVSETEGGWTEEHWMAPRGGVMLGTNRSGKGGRATGFEFMRIAADRDGRVAFWGAPRGKTPVSFPLVASSAGEAVFENPQHDYPTRIHYRREGNKLTAIVSGPGGANPMRWEFRRASPK